MSADTEGYSCVMDAEVGAWIVVDRFGVAAGGEPPYENYVEARHRAERLNDDVFRRRFT